jgi:hypothetical protein
MPIFALDRRAMTIPLYQALRLVFKRQALKDDQSGG